MSETRTIPKTGPLAAKRCSSCAQPILWTLTEAGKKMPVDLHPSADGTIAIERADAVDGPFWESFVVPELERAGKVLRKSHYASCPDAATWRRR